MALHDCNIYLVGKKCFVMYHIHTAVLVIYVWCNACWLQISVDP